jgi:moderate conductance mechanosensitive channel
LRIVAETLPMKHAGVTRNIKRDVKECLDAHGIEIPYPRMVMYSKNSGNITEPGV